VRFTQLTDLALVSGGVASILVLLNVLYLYGLVAERRFSSPIGILWYCVVPSLLAFVFFGALRLKPVQKRRVTAVCLVFVALIYGFEITFEVTDREGVRWLHPLARSTASAREAACDVDQKIAELRRSGFSAVRSVVTPVAAYDTTQATVSSDGRTHVPKLIAFSGIARRKTVACEEGGRWLIYDSDEHGFHNPLGLWNSGQVDIAAMGNSWTQGCCLPSDSNFVSLMRVRHPATVNLGMSGQGPLQILGIAREYLSVLRPKVVVWFYFEGNGLQELQDEKKHEFLLRYVRPDFSQGLIRRQQEIDRAGEVRNRQRETQARQEKQVRDSAPNAAFATLRSVITLTSLRTTFGLVYGEDAQGERAREDLKGPTMALFRDIVAALKNEVASWGGTLVFVYLPSHERYGAGTGAALSVDSQQRKRVLQLIDEMGIPIIDILPVFSVRGGNLLFDQWRFTEEGNRIVAEQVLDGMSPIAPNLSRTR